MDFFGNETVLLNCTELDNFESGCFEEKMKNANFYIVNSQGCKQLMA